MARQQHGPLQQFSTPLALFPEFVARDIEPLVLDEKHKALADGSFSVQTWSGRLLFHVQHENTLDGGHKRVLFDNQRNLLFTINRQHSVLAPRYYAEDTSGRRILDVQYKLSIGHSRATCSFTSIDGKQTSLSMQGGLFDARADITDEATGLRVAVIDRKFCNVHELFSGKQMYVVSVAPNVDMALITALCICLDEKRDKNRR